MDKRHRIEEKRKCFSTPDAGLPYVVAMRLIRILVAALIGVVLTLLGFLLFQFPLEIAKDIIIHPIAEEISAAIGLKVPTIETIISSVSIVVPFLAAICTMYLYHLIYDATQSRRFALIRESAPTTLGTKIKTWVSVFFLAAFVVAVLVGGYRARREVALPLKYVELRKLPNLELRERALAIGNRLNELSDQYGARQDELENEYRKAMNKYSEDHAEFERKKTDYENAARTCQPYSSGIQMPSSTLSLGSSGLVGIPNSNLLGQPTCTIPPVPTPPARPEFPAVKVDAQWQAQMQSVQEEAAAIWEELRHRAGGYTQFLTVPSTYSERRSTMSGPARLLMDTANKLH